MTHYFDAKNCIFLCVNSEKDRIKFIKLKDLREFVVTETGEIKTNKENSMLYLCDCIYIPEQLYNCIAKILTHEPKPIFKR